MFSLLIHGEMIEFTVLYSIAFGCILAALIIRRPLILLTQHVFPFLIDAKYLPPLPRLAKRVTRFMNRYLIYPGCLHRGRFVNRWNRLDIVFLALYLGANIACVVAPLRGIEQAGLRSGTLAIINIILLFASPYLSLLADVLGLSLESCRRLHSSVGSTTILLSAFHAAVGAAVKRGLDLHTSRDLFALVVRQFSPGKYTGRLTDIYLGYQYYLCTVLHCTCAKRKLRDCFAHSPYSGVCFGVCYLATCPGYETSSAIVFVDRSAHSLGLLSSSTAVHPVSQPWWPFASSHILRSAYDQSSRSSA